jgi:hypothetical protein
MHRRRSDMPLHMLSGAASGVAPPPSACTHHAGLGWLEARVPPGGWCPWRACRRGESLSAGVLVTPGQGYANITPGQLPTPRKTIYMHHQYHSIQSYHDREPSIARVIGRSGIFQRPGNLCFVPRAPPHGLRCALSNVYWCVRYFYAGRKLQESLQVAGATPLPMPQSGGSPPSSKHRPAVPPGLHMRARHYNNAK